MNPNGSSLHPIFVDPGFLVGFACEKKMKLGSKNFLVKNASPKMVICIYIYILLVFVKKFVKSSEKKSKFTSLKKQIKVHITGHWLLKTELQTTQTVKISQKISLSFWCLEDPMFHALTFNRSHLGESIR